MTYDEYLLLVEQAAVDNPEWRGGQAAVNVLAVVRPDLSEALRGRSGLDPFYVDANLPRFWEWVDAHWTPEPVAP